MSSLRAWLQSIGLDKYAKTFEQHDLDLDVLAELNDDEFKELGVSLGDRKRLQKSLRDHDAPHSSAAAALQTEPAKASHAERRNVTVMFCDLVGSTALADGLDPETFRDLLGIYQEAAREPIRRYGGHIARYLGDGLLVFYGFPRAREDDAVRAVRSALEVLRAVQDLPDVDLRVRLGLATGIVVAGDIVGTDRYEDQTVLGDVPNLAARLQSCAEPDTVLIAKSTYEVVRHAVDVAELPPLSLKGIANPVTAYRVLGVRDAGRQDDGASSHKLGRMVGREGELALIASRWDLARRGSGQVVLISAEAGVGKSRLTRQIREDTSGASRAIVSFYCSPYQSSTPFFPVTDAITRAAGFTPHDGRHQRIEKLKQWFEALEYGRPDGVALLCSILGIEMDDALPTSPEERRRKTLNFLSELIVHLARREAALIIVEDLHFSDSSTIEVISLIIEQIQELPALLLMTFRPSFAPPWKAIAHATLIAMNHLTTNESRRLVKVVAGEKHLPPDVEAQVVERCDGVPLFIEELTKSVVESLDHETNRIAIPVTLRDTLAARLDALEEAKRVAQTASVIGREFDYRVLEGLVPDNASLPDHLEQLHSAELILRRGEIPDARYLFKHALVQEAAYESLLFSDRRAIHLALGEQLAQEESELSSPPGLIALHFERGGELRRSLDYRHRAGNRAAKASALVEAEDHFRRALNILEALPDAESLADYHAELLLGLGAVQMPLHGYPSKPVHQTYSQCYELLTDSANLSKRFDATWGLWLNRCIAGDLERSQQLTSELDAIAAESKSASDQLQADHAVFTVSYILGDLHKTYERTQAVRNSYSIDQFGDHCLRYGGHDPYVCSQCHGALSRWQMGYPQEAIGFCRDALDLAETLKHPPSTGVAVSLSAIFYQFTGDTASILALEEHADSAPTNMRLIMQAVAGWSKVILGSSDEGLQQCSDGAKAYRDLGAKARLSYVEYLLADAYLKLGRLDEALAIIEPACNQANDITTKAERFRLRAEILQRLGKMDQAEQIYFDAAKIARDQGALAWELRTTLSLSELRLSQDRRLEARDLLTPVYNRFSEGFATPDLQRARAVLSELAE